MLWVVIKELAEISRAGNSVRCSMLEVACIFRKRRARKSPRFSKGIVGSYKQAGG
jgi:hypothetical protein